LYHSTGPYGVRRNVILIGYNYKPALSGDLIDCCVFGLALKWVCVLCIIVLFYSPSRHHSMLSTESSKKYDLTHTYRVRQNKVAPKVFRCFLSNRLEILQMYFLKCSTSKCQVKCYSIETGVVP